MFCFVVLHYKNIEDTLKCIDKIHKLKKSKKIIVVDNNSCSDEDVEKIKNKKVDLLLLDKNYGFAKANNKGINFAKEKYDPEFIIVINNDVLIEQNDFLNQINIIYKKYNFDILGPLIESTTGESINPFPVIKSKEELNNEIKKTIKLIKIYNSNILYNLLQLYIKIKHKFIKIPIRKNGENIELCTSLHGCAIIFSRKYLNRYKFAFFNETFLFHEEEFLYQRIINDKLISLYNPSLKVFHKEGATTKFINKNERESKLFRETERLKSLKLLEKKWGKEV